MPRGHAHLYEIALAGTPGMRPLFGEPTWKRNRNASADARAPRWIPKWTPTTSPNTHTTNAAIGGLHAYRQVDSVNCTTLDIVAAREPQLCCDASAAIDFLKVDTEGTEAEVLFEGARQLLAERRVRSILWEYGDKISAVRCACFQPCLLQLLS